MRLIDADAVIKKLQDVLDEKADQKDTVAYLTFELFIDRLKEEPTIEAEPVRHGRWELECKNLPFERAYFYRKCSVCGIQTWKGCDVNYCPNCGAKMDLEGE